VASVPYAPRVARNELREGYGSIERSFDVGPIYRLDRMQDLDWIGAGGGETIPIVWDVLSALAAQESGAGVLYLAGGAVSVTSALPDVGLISVERMTGVAAEIVARTSVPLLVDADSGFGGPPVLVQLCASVLRAGGVGIVLGDDDVPGHMRRDPGVVSPEAMARRLRLARTASEGQLRIVARTSIDGDEPLAVALGRVGPYVEAGADAVMVRGARSREELEEIASVTRESGGSPFTVVFRSPASGYFATPRDARELAFDAIIVGAPQYAVYPFLRTLYDAAMEGDIDELWSRQMDRADFARAIDAARYTDAFPD